MFFSCDFHFHSVATYDSKGIDFELDIIENYFFEAWTTSVH